MITPADTNPAPTRRLITTTVANNTQLCREHFRLTVVAGESISAQPGQFVHLSPQRAAESNYRTFAGGWGEVHAEWVEEWRQPMLRRAFSIAGLRDRGATTELDVIYRVVGAGTRWMAGLQAGEEVSLLGPLGNAFPVSSNKRHAWLVAGGVGLPPMLWLAEALAGAQRQTVAFCGAQTKELLPLALDDHEPPDRDASRATLSTGEFARHGVPVVISTDDGTYGFRGHIGAALSAFANDPSNAVSPEDLVVYTCGPERMMHFVAEYCVARGIECYVCMERAMACGTGTCQSCVVGLQTPAQADEWRYALCCTEGPVFRADSVLW